MIILPTHICVTRPQWVKNVNKGDTMTTNQWPHARLCYLQCNSNGDTTAKQYTIIMTWSSKWFGASPSAQFWEILLLFTAMKNHNFHRISLKATSSMPNYWLVSVSEWLNLTAFLVSQHWGNDLEPRTCQSITSTNDGKDESGPVAGRGPTSAHSFEKYDFQILMGWCKKDMTPVHLQWSYVFLTLTHWYILWWSSRSFLQKIHWHALLSISLTIRQHWLR